MAKVTIAGNVNTAKRSDFLTGLCLLSIIGSCWFLLCSIIQFFKADAQNTAVAKEVREILATDEFQRSIASGIAPKMGLQDAERMVEAFSVENLQLISIAGLVSAIFCLIGVYFMWDLKKKGFYFYLAGILIGFLILLSLFGFTRVFSMGMLALNGIITLFKLLGANSYLANGAMILILFTWAFFIFGYWRQLKFMK